jgi:hypothetical protein
LKGDDIAKKIKFHKLFQMKQIVIKRIKINSKGRINERLLSNFRGSAHKPRERERGKKGKKEKVGRAKPKRHLKHIPQTKGMS